MSDPRARLLSEIDHHRRRIDALHDELRRLDQADTAWPPRRFYGTYYAVAGMVLGVIGSLTSFLFNVVGSYLVSQDPMYVLRVFGTFFVGAEALDTPSLNFLVLVLMAHFSVGSAGGAAFLWWLARYHPGAPLSRRLLFGGGFGLAIWIANFYLVSSWLQPWLFGEAYLLALMPFWVAALTHLVYGWTLGLLEPIGRFVPHRVPTA